MREGAASVLVSTTASLRYAIANVVSRLMASSSSETARANCPASLAFRACEYLRSASSDPVVTCSSGSLARIARSDSPIRSRSLAEQPHDARLRQVYAERLGERGPERRVRRAVLEVGQHQAVPLRQHAARDQGPYRSDAE